MRPIEQPQLHRPASATARAAARRLRTSCRAPPACIFRGRRRASRRRRDGSSRDARLAAATRRARGGARHARREAEDPAARSTRRVRARERASAAARTRSPCVAAPRRPARTLAARRGRARCVTPPARTAGRRHALSSAPPAAERTSGRVRPRPAAWTVLPRKHLAGRLAGPRRRCEQLRARASSRWPAVRGSGRPSAARGDMRPHQSASHAAARVAPRVCRRQWAADIDDALKLFEINLRAEGGAPATTREARDAPRALARRRLAVNAR